MPWLHQLNDWFCCAARTVVSIDGYEDVPVNDETALAKAVTSQPVSVAICASEAMQFYSSGIIAAKGSCTGLNHGVLAVGYDKANLLFHCLWYKRGEHSHVQRKSTMQCRSAWFANLHC